MEWKLLNTPLLFTESKDGKTRVRLEANRDIHIKDGCIHHIGHYQDDSPALDSPDNRRNKSSIFELNLGTERTVAPNSGAHQSYQNEYPYFALPSFINAHDSLLASYYPFDVKQNTASSRERYPHWLAWDNELKSSSLFRERMLLEPSELYLIGDYKNIINGVGTVVDHIPHFVRKPFQKKTQVCLLEDFGISHSLSSYSLDWGEGIAHEHHYAAENELPYIIHIAEGFDKESRDSLKLLEKEGALDEHTVLVHGISLSLDDLDRIAKANAHLVWCPVSNLHIYGQSSLIKEALDRGINLCIGSDASMLGSKGILHDIQTAARYYEQRYQLPLNPATLLSMLSKNAEQAFRIHANSSIAEAGAANFTIVKAQYPRDPYRSIAELNYSDIHLMVQNGIPIYASVELSELFDTLKIDYFKCALGKGAYKILRNNKSFASYQDTWNKLEQLPHNNLTWGLSNFLPKPL